MALAPAEAPARWRDLRTRVLSAALLAPVALGSIWVGDWSFRGLVFVLAFGLALEWSQICGQRPVSVVGGILLMAVLVAVGCAATSHWFAAILALIIGTGVGALSGHVEDRRAMDAPRGAARASRPDVGRSRYVALFGIPYIGLAAVSLLWLRDDPIAGRANVLFLLLLVWASDIGAYLVGRLLGGPRLAPRISPGKTWSGAAGGLLAALLVGLGAALVMPSATAYSSVVPASFVSAIVVTVLLAIVSQGGDLFESLIKRHFGVKDSGHIIPGHGGLLDRLDALLAAAPVAALLALAAGRGVVLWQ